MKKNNRMRLLGALLLAGAVVFAGAPAANAAAPASATCTGELAPGSYRNVTVNGMCSLDGSVQITGNVSVKAGSTLFLEGAEVGGNLGLTRGSVAMLMGATIHGNVGASNARALYVFNSRIDRNLSFIGGGSGRNCVDPDPETSFANDTMVKDSSIGGNATFNGWSGCWFGFLRNTVGKNVQISNMYANPENINYPGTDQETAQGLDSTEVVGNDVGGVLNCTGNTPVAQVGDAPPPFANSARLLAGECAAL